MKIQIYYWREKQNFGDLLGELLIKHFLHLQSEWAPAKEADVAIVGSILEHLPHDYRGIIAGCGKLHKHSRVHLPHAKIIGLRGYLTAHGVKGNYVVADPGLLADELVPVEEKEHNLGIVPHWTDTELEHNPIFLRYKPKIIRVYGDPLEAISEISKCKKIVSSSLHGIILADSLGIPRRIEIPPRAISHPHIEGGLFKWHDYSSSIGMKLKIGETQEVDRRIVTEKQHELFDMFQELKSLIKHGCH